MRTLDRLRSPQRSPAGTTARLISLLAMLGVIALLIHRASDPDTWRWLADDPSPAAVSQTVQVAGENAASPSGDAAPVKTTAPIPKETVERGPTDTDPEELASFVEEAQAISDRTLFLRPEEMPSYWRMYQWVQRQSFTVLQERATKQVLFNDFVQDPETSRRRIVQLDLEIRRAIKREVRPNTAGVTHVYELIGPTKESTAWPYQIIVPELPPGMPVGTDVNERVRFAGYFFKLQTYHAAGAGPSDKPLPIPVLMGRLSWRPSAVANGGKPQSDFALLRQMFNQGWVWWLGALALLAGVVRLGFWLLGSGRQNKLDKLQRLEATPLHEPDRLNQFLHETETGAEIDDSRRRTPYNEGRMGFDDFDIKRNARGK